MKFSCTKENLVQALGLVGSLAQKHVNLPILSNVLLKVEEQKVELSATNLEIAITAHVRAKVEEAGSFTVPARTFADIISLTRDEKIEITLKDQELYITSGKSVTKIKGSVADEYPIIPRIEGGKLFSFSRIALKSALAQVTPATAKSDIRPELAGVFCGFNVRGTTGLTLAATDSYRLAERRVPYDQGESDELRIILPGKTAQDIVRILAQSEEETVRWVIAENQIHVSTGGVDLLSRLIEGAYPDYTQIIPREFETTVVIPTDILSKEIKAAGLFTTTGVNAVQLEVDPDAGAVRLSSSSTQTGEYHSEIPANVTGKSVQIVLSHRYVLDGLNTIDTTGVVFNIVGPDSPCVVTPEGADVFRYIVMPILQ